MTGEMPSGEVDHERSIRTDNKWSKLRGAARSENAQNLQRAHADNKVGLLGVSRHREKFTAFIRADGKNKYLGVFDTPELAHAAYLAAKAIHHPTSSLAADFLRANCGNPGHHVPTL